MAERRYLTGAAWDHDNQKFIGKGLPKYVYYVSLWGMIAHALLYTRPGNTVDFVIDRHQELQNRVKAFYDETRAGPVLKPTDRNKLGRMTYYVGGKPQPEGLQAADLYAYLWTSWFRYGEQDMPAERRDILYEVAKNPVIERRIGIYDAENLERVVATSPYRAEFKGLS